MITQDLESWLREIGVGGSGGIGVRGLTPLAGDLSQRRYFRIVLDDGALLLAAHYPESLRGAMGRFAAARSLLAGAGVRVPEIRRSSSERGWMLVEDLGAETLYELGNREPREPREPRPPSELEAHVRAAVESAGKIAALNVNAVAELGNPPLDGAALRRELDPAFEFLLDAQGLSELPRERRELLLALDELCDHLGGDPLVPCHRDFMSRNLIPLADGIAVIDFQDLRLGPPAYDLASLFNDSFFPDSALENALLPAEWKTGLAHEQYSRAVVQRTLKAAGTFARFAAQGQPRHVLLIAPTLARTARHLAALPETAGAFGPLRGWWSSHPGAGPIC